MLRIQRKPQEVLATLRAWVKACPEDSVARRVLFKECVATGDHEAAVEAAEPLVTLESTDAQAHALLADELLKINRAADAAAHFRRALELEPKVTGNPTKPVWVNNYAWLLATHPDSTVRNGDEALRWAKEACEAVNYEAWGMVDTLAAAYAETGQFDEAIKYMQQILDRARANGDTQVAELAEAHLKLYQSRQPFREK
jgi:Flp pilus assembly protein TadD